jgi:hypothetical protein
MCVFVYKIFVRLKQCSSNLELDGTQIMGARQLVYYQSSLTAMLSMLTPSAPKSAPPALMTK